MSYRNILEMEKQAVNEQLEFFIDAQESFSYYGTGILVTTMTKNS